MHHIKKGVAKLPQINGFMSLPFRFSITFNYAELFFLHFEAQFLFSNLKIRESENCHKNEMKTFAIMCWVRCDGEDERVSKMFHNEKIFAYLRVKNSHLNSPFSIKMFRSSMMLIYLHFPHFVITIWPQKC